MNRFLKTIFFSWIIINIFVFSAWTFATFARLKNKKGSKSEAVAYYKIAAALNPFYGETLKELANLSGDKEKEILLKKALRFNPGDDGLWAELARAHFSQQRFEDSISDYENAIRQNPKNPFYYAQLAKIYVLREQFDSALILYQKAVQVEPLYISAHCNIASIHLLKGKKSDALNAFQNVLKIKSYALKPSSNYSKGLVDLDLDPAWVRQFQNLKNSSNVRR